MLKERRLLQQIYVVATEARRSTRSLSRDKQLHTCNKDTKLCHDTTSRSRRRRQIWAIIFRDSHIALILRPKLLRLYKYKQLEKVRQSISIGRTRVPRELRTLLFYIFFFFSHFFFFSSYIRFRVGLVNLFTGSEIVNCSEVLKLNLKSEIHLQLLFECNELQTKVGTHFFS